MLFLIFGNVKLSLIIENFRKDEAVSHFFYNSLDAARRELIKE